MNDKIALLILGSTGMTAFTQSFNHSDASFVLKMQE